MKIKVKDEEKVTLYNASKALESASRRIALIHLSYARTIIEELGHEKGSKIISEAIKDYGEKIGEITRDEVLEILGSYYEGLTEKVEIKVHKKV